MRREEAKMDLWGLILQVLVVQDLGLNFLVPCPPESAGISSMVVLVPYLMGAPTLYLWVVLVLHPWVVPAHHCIGVPTLHPLVVLVPYPPTVLVLHPWLVSVSHLQGWSLSWTHSQS